MALDLINTPESYALRFGDGTLVVDTGTFHGRPAVFVKPSTVAGPIGGKPPETGPLDRLLPGEVVWTFPTMDQAKAVQQALFGRSAAPDAERARIRALHAALSRREWSEAEQAANALRDAFNSERPVGEWA